MDSPSTSVQALRSQIARLKGVIDQHKLQEPRKHPPGHQYTRARNNVYVNPNYQPPKRSSKFVASRAPHRSYKPKPIRPKRTINRRTLSKRKYFNKPCPRFSTTGACNRGLTCMYQHDPSKIAICWNFLHGNCSNTAESCGLSHDPTPERTPPCLHFANNGRCTREDCPFPHVRLGQRQGVCRDFAVFGYCGKGLDCERQHIRECPDFAEKGKCTLKGCKLPHVIRANRNRKADAGMAAIGIPAHPSSPVHATNIDNVNTEHPPGAVESTQLGDEYISLTFHESESDSESEDEQDSEDSGRKYHASPLRKDPSAVHIPVAITGGATALSPIKCPRMNSSFTFPLAGISDLSDSPRVSCDMPHHADESSLWPEDLSTLSQPSNLSGEANSQLSHSEFVFPDETSGQSIRGNALFPADSMPHLLYSSNLNQQSLLLSPAETSTQYADMTFQSSPLYSVSPPIIYSDTPRNTPAIYVETSGLNPLLSTTPDSLRTPYDQYPFPYNRRPSLPTPSSSTSRLPITPGASPMSTIGSPFVSSSPHSPVSPSMRGPIDQQGRDPHAKASMRTVQELAVACSSPYDGLLVPQRTYRPHTQSDRRRYVEEVELEPPIMFLVQNPEGCGIPLRDALNSKFMRLVDRDDLMFRQRGPSVSIRLMWPGYTQWSRQIPTRDFRSPPGPITRSKLAKNVAKTIERFIQEMQSQQMEEDADPRWRVGARHITIDHLSLVGLQHVSMGSWQCHVRLNRTH
ncbi:uncharacterized protein FIBRA_09400 [Fibroporia radiculosa]|uniref:C3H1-type domain-containing protein n=1 Tax=Fibroporia radiculosa TaxID=599839 RepID=J7SCD3_9APHY|nr:uncharacterized protein FIBRA_09400 [Fibroporia radiculosa]CCM07076.1 predicted protein [Fibroporia radiculosa]